MRSSLRSRRTHTIKHRCTSGAAKARIGQRAAAHAAADDQRARLVRADAEAPLDSTCGSGLRRGPRAESPREARPGRRACGRRARDRMAGRRSPRARRANASARCACLQRRRSRDRRADSPRVVSSSPQMVTSANGFASVDVRVAAASCTPASVERGDDLGIVRRADRDCRARRTCRTAR